MRSRSGLWVLALFVAVLVAARLYPARVATGTANERAVPLATPAGITLQLRSHKDRRALPETVYADARGMTLYMHARADGTPLECVGECARLWPPLLAAADATPEEQFALVARADGTRQWTHRGRPLYRSSKDSNRGDAAGDGDEDGAWHAALYKPATLVSAPDGISVQELGDAGGAGLVTAAGLALYEYDGSVSAHPKDCAGRNCTHDFQPLEAPAIASAAGEFAPVAREDGITQWTFRGRPLYTFDGDRKPEDVTGVDVDPRFKPALVERYFMPADARIHRNVVLGAIVTTAGGQTLYQLDRFIDEERHEFRRDHGPPSLGRSLGTASCDAECTREWIPFKAPAGAQPSAYWDVLTRSDGSRQWAYKGFALYTYAKDKAGQLGGHEIYTLGQAVDNSGLGPSGHRGNQAMKDIPADVYVPAGSAAAGLGISAFFWHAVVP